MCKNNKLLAAKVEETGIILFLKKGRSLFVN